MMKSIEIKGLTMKHLSMPQVLLGLGLVILLGAGLYVAAKRIKRYQAEQPRSDAQAVLQVGNLKRGYDFHIPAAYDSQKPMPLVLAFHGTGGNGPAMAEMTGLNQIADQSGFIVVYPDAIGAHWNARRGGKPDTTNDLGFVSALIDEMGQKYNLDRRRIYATGFSNGGTFSYRLACELSDKITAIAAVSAPMPEYVAQHCQSSKPVPMLLMHGTKDSAFPYGSVPAPAVLTVADTVKYWGTRNQCSPKMVTETLAKSPHVRIDSYQNCKNDASVKFYTIEGAEHGWGDADLKMVDPAHQKMNPSAVIWDFFRQHVHP